MTAKLLEKGSDRMTVGEHRESAKLLDNRIRELSGFDDLAGNGQAPEWYGRLLSGLVLAADGGDPMYVSGSYDEDEELEYFSAQVVVFTRELVLHAKISGSVSAKADADVFVSVISRSSLRTFQVAAAAGAFAADLSDKWPGRVRLKVVFPGLELSLPLGPATSNSSNSELVNLIGSLNTDLREANLGAD